MISRVDSANDQTGLRNRVEDTISYFHQSGSSASIIIPITTRKFEFEKLHKAAVHQEMLRFLSWLFWGIFVLFK